MPFSKHTTGVAFQHPHGLFVRFGPRDEDWEQVLFLEQGGLDDYEVGQQVFKQRRR